MASAGRPRPCCAASPRAARRCAKRKPTASADEVSPHPNPPPPAGEGGRGEAEDGWGLLKIAGEKSEVRFGEVRGGGGVRVVDRPRGSVEGGGGPGQPPPLGWWGGGLS